MGHFPLPGLFQPSFPSWLFCLSSLLFLVQAKAQLTAGQTGTSKPCSGTQHCGLCRRPQSLNLSNQIHYCIEDGTYTFCPNPKEWRKKKEGNRVDQDKGKLSGSAQSLGGEGGSLRQPPPPPCWWLSRGPQQLGKERDSKQPHWALLGYVLLGLGVSAVEWCMPVLQSW